MKDKVVLPWLAMKSQGTLSGSKDSSSPKNFFKPQFYFISSPPITGLYIRVLIMTFFKYNYCYKKPPQIPIKNTLLNAVRKSLLCRWCPDQNLPPPPSPSTSAPALSAL